MGKSKGTGGANNDPRRSARVEMGVEVIIRRPGQARLSVSVQDLSRHGCKLEFRNRPSVDERVWVKIDGLEPLPGRVCWLDGFAFGVEFEKDLHPAVFDHLILKLANSSEIE
jgi:hypothetical protein